VYKGRTVAVVVPAYNEERQIGKVLETMPDFVDKIVVVDDASRDSTAEVVEGYRASYEDRVVLIRHERNQGHGGARVSGFKWAEQREIEIVACMDADGQMDPAELLRLLDPIVEGAADYTKGNRLFSGNAWQIMPKFRYLGGAFVSLLTKIASGYWHVADSQTGFFAMSLCILRKVDWDRTYKRYGCPIDYLVRLNVANARVRDVPITPIYNVGERSDMTYFKVIPRVLWLLLRMFVWRLVQKYVIRDFHPLVLFYFFGAVGAVISFALFIRLLVLWVALGYAPPMTSLAFGFFSMISLQLIMFAMWFDMEANKALKG
jgi:glycosyltransferase involved in cell wall biosynthesis